MSEKHSRLKKNILRVVVGVVVVAVVVVVGLWSWPVGNYPSKEAEGTPMAYSEALSKIKEVQSEEGKELTVECKSEALIQGEKTSQSVLLLHGYTNCPAQYSQLQRQLYEAGYNVYVPRLPRHGYKDRMTEDLQNLQAQNLIDTVSQSLEIAKGLGDDVVVLGISGSGILANWSLYQSPQVKKAISVSPLLVPRKYNYTTIKPATNFLQVWPNWFIRWDEYSDSEGEGPEYAYPRFATQGLAEFLKIGLDLKGDLESGEAPTNISNKELVLITTEGDEALNLKAVKQHADLWREQGTKVTEHTFSSDLNVGHDTIDPNNPKANTQETYPVFLDFIQE